MTHTSGYILERVQRFFVHPSLLSSMNILRKLLACVRLFKTRNDALDSSDEPGGEEFKLPKMASLLIVITYNIMLQVSFFIIISSSSKYAEYLGGTATFSGIVIGIPTLISGMALVPMTKYDKGRYKTALHIGCFSAILGHIVYAIAYRAKFLYLILIGRCLSGVSFSLFMYLKRYCTDPLIVGVRRRTTLSSWLVIGQALGMTLGPFLGGLLYKVGFHNDIFNGYTSPGWVMAFCYAIFWIIVARYFEDVPSTLEISSELCEMIPVVRPVEKEKEKQDCSPTSVPHSDRPRSPAQEVPLVAEVFSTTLPQWGVIICMCWFSMLCFFILGSWEATLPVFGAATSSLNWSPYEAGNFIALGGITAFPFFLANIIFARRIEDRQLLGIGTGLGMSGLLIFVSLLAARKVVYGSLFACWWPIALGFNLATTVTLSLLSKQFPPHWNRRTSMAIQYSNYVGRLTGAIWGGSSVAVGMENFVGLEVGLVGVGGALFVTLWRNLKTKTG